MVCCLQKLLQCTWFHRTSIPFTVPGRAPFPNATYTESSASTSLTIPCFGERKKTEHLLKDLLFRKQEKQHFFLKQLTLMNPKLIKKENKKSDVYMLIYFRSISWLLWLTTFQILPHEWNILHLLQSLQWVLCPALTCTHIFHKWFLYMAAEVKKEERKCYLHL